MILRLTFRESITEWKEDGADRVGFMTMKIKHKDYDTDGLGKDGKDWVEQLNIRLAKWGNKILNNNTLESQSHIVFLALHNIDTKDDFTRYIQLQEA